MEKNKRFLTDDERAVEEPLDKIKDKIWAAMVPPEQLMQRFKVVPTFHYQWLERGEFYQTGHIMVCAVDDLGCPFSVFSRLMDKRELPEMDDVDIEDMAQTLIAKIREGLITKDVP